MVCFVVCLVRNAMINSTYNVQWSVNFEGIPIAIEGNFSTRFQTWWFPSMAQFITTACESLAQHRHVDLAADVTYIPSQWQARKDLCTKHAQKISKATVHTFSKERLARKKSWQESQVPILPKPAMHVSAVTEDIDYDNRYSILSDFQGSTWGLKTY